MPSPCNCVRTRPVALPACRLNAACRPGSFDHTALDDCRTEGLAPAKTHWARPIDTPPFHGYALRPGVTFTYVILGEVVVSAAPSVAPSLSITRQSDGDVELTFTGTLQSASSMDGPFTDVPGNPVGSHVLPAAGLAAQQFFRVR